MKSKTYYNGGIDMTKKIGILSTVLVLVCVALVVAFAITKNNNAPEAELTYEVMDQEWSQSYLTIEPGQIIKQFMIPEEAVLINLGRMTNTGLNAVHLYVKVDWYENDIVIALRNPDGTFLERIPICPPFCDKVETASIQ